MKLDTLSWQLQLSALCIVIALPLMILSLYIVEGFSTELHDFKFIHDAAPLLGLAGNIGIFCMFFTGLLAIWHFSFIAALAFLFSTVAGCVLLKPGLSPPQDWDIEMEGDRKRNESD